MGNILYNSISKKRGHERNLNGVRETIRRIKDDLRVAETDGTGMGPEVRTESSSYKYGKWPHGASDIHGPRPRT